MGELSELKNISSVTEKILNDAGIYTVEQLKNLGGKEAFLQVKKNDPDSCLNMLYGLEGAVKGIRWCDLDQTVKDELKAFYQSLSYDEEEDTI